MLYDGVEIDIYKLFHKNSLIDNLKESDCTDHALTEICSQYKEKFGQDLICCYPNMTGKDVGTFFIPVQEGFLSIPYDEKVSEEYRTLNLDKAFLLSYEEIYKMKTGWENFAAKLSETMKSMLQIQALREIYEAH